ncbi:protein YAE1 isoform X1 [Ricinus communis]|uniref:protein YAE1 isoform X1 n=1 Tax=Ricinus communis TaxID=3988 RepID=UPI00201B2F31|nr:protein YAE1 isoform X1 [Ricinus communis]
MEGGFAEELYSETLQLSKLELVPGHDEDGAFWGDSDEELHKSSDLDREWERRRDQFHTIGYRDGLLAGKEAIAQEGFNAGFKQSVLLGFDWGLVRGVTSAFACLPDGLKEKLIETPEKRNKFLALYESVHSLSTTDALKLFYDDIVSKKAAEQSEHATASSDTAGLQYKISDCSLGNYGGELQSLLIESPAIDSHIRVD